MAPPDERPATTQLQPDERAVLDALRKRIRTARGVAAGHDIRQDLLRAGLDKLAIGVAVQALVEQGLIERIRRDEPDGTFYTAYRFTARAAAWLRAHGDGVAGGDD